MDTLRAPSRFHERSVKLSRAGTAYAAKRRKAAMRLLVVAMSNAALEHVATTLDSTMAGADSRRLGSSRCR
jgi:hypothetical protein